MSQDSMFPTRWLSLSGRELRLIGIVALVALVTCGATYVVRNYWWYGGMTVKARKARLPRPARLNVNTAKSFELRLLPGIGPHTATDILTYRRRHGHFERLGELKKVKGIGPATVEKIRPHAMCAAPDAGGNTQK
jgi:competence protein ComEA